MTGKLLYGRMIENADGKLAAMEEDRYDDVAHDVMRFTVAYAVLRPLGFLPTGRQNPQGRHARSGPRGKIRGRETSAKRR